MAYHIVSLRDAPISVESVKTYGLDFSFRNPEYRSAIAYIDSAYRQCRRRNLRINIKTHIMRDDIGELVRPSISEIEPMSRFDALNEIVREIWCVAVRLRNLDEK